MQRKSLLTALSVVLCILAVGAGVFLFKNQYYYPVTAAVLLFSCIPFCVAFRHRRVRTRELVLVAVMTALAVASRAAFYMLPSVKPLCAIAIIAGIAFGAETGFVVGALSMFLSNFLFGQGPWTPFQVFGMGITAFVASLVLRRGILRSSRMACALIGGAVCFLLYGVIADTSSVLLMRTGDSIGAVLSVYAAGVPFNAVHGVTTGITLFFLSVPMNERLERLRIKYGLFKSE